MGLQGPLTAQALGRSPYDDVFQGEGPDDGQESTQQYDHRGRPINPESKRINKDIIRSHNEVMLVVGVAEPENPQSEPEAELKRQHFAYEEDIGTRVIWATKRCIDAVGIFGATGFRQRILLYREYSTTPLMHIYQSSRQDFSIWRDMLPGAASALLSQHINRRWFPPWSVFQRTGFHHTCLQAGWTYARTHLELFAAFQRLGLISSHQILPSWRYFIPFTDDSPIPAPPPLQDVSPTSIATWLGGVTVSLAPLVLWAFTQKLVLDWRPHIWQRILINLPSPMFGGKSIYHVPVTPPSPPPAADMAQVIRESSGVDDDEDARAHDGGEDVAVEDDDVLDDLLTSPESEMPPELGTNQNRRDSLPSVGGARDDFDSDDDEHEVVSATLISFDVEATEATDVPQGLWSAELRPSMSPDGRQSGPPTAVYLSTMLTRLPSLMAAKMLNDSLLRLLVTPCEAMALRYAASVFLARHGLPMDHILDIRLLSGFTMTWLVNYLGGEILHLAACAEVWTISAALARHFHMSEEQWKESGGVDWTEWLGPWLGPWLTASSEPLF